MAVYVFWIALIGVALYVARFGGRDLRIAMCILAIDFCLSAFFYYAKGRTWLDWPIGVLATDATASVLLVVLALRSDRFWPMPIAALMLIPVMTPLVTLVGKGLESSALGWTQGIWSYVQFLILIVATKRHRLRSVLRSPVQGEGRFPIAPRPAL